MHSIIYLSKRRVLRLNNIFYNNKSDDVQRACVQKRPLRPVLLAVLPVIILYENNNNNNNNKNNNNNNAYICVHIHVERRGVSISHARVYGGVSRVSVCACVGFYRLGFLRVH